MIRRSWLLLAACMAVAPLAFSQTITEIKPASATAGTGPVNVVLNGQYYQVPAPTVYWAVSANSPIPLNIVGTPTLTQIVVTIPASLLTQPETAQIYVLQGSGYSNSVNFTVTPGAPTLTSLSPSSAAAGSPALTLTVNGTNFPAAGNNVTWNGAVLQTTFVNSGQLTAAVPAALLTSAGTAVVCITAQPEPSPLTFTITSSPLVLSAIAPTSATAGSPGFTLTVNGAGFTPSTTVTWNGSPLSTGFVNSTLLNATVPANLIATAGSASVGVTAPGQTSPAPILFAINSALTLTGLSPASAVAGGSAFTLTLNGAGFGAQTVVYWNSFALSTTFVNGSVLTATVPALLIAQAGSASITVQGGGRTSNALLFNITAAPLVTLTSVSPNTVVAGSAAFTLTANGSGFYSGAAVTWNGSPLSTTFVSPAQLSAIVPASLIAGAGTVSVGVSVPGQTSPAPLSLVITPNLAITSVAPSSTTAGGPAFTLTVNGTGFTSGTTVFWNTTALATTPVNAGQLTATVPAGLIAQPGSASITAQTGNLVSNAVTFTITTPLPVLTSISPSTAVAGRPAFTLTVNGSGFLSGTTVLWNGASLGTTFVSSTQLNAAVTANLIAQQGSASVTVSSGDSVSNALTFTITAPVPAITSISPSSVTAGSASLTLTINGTGFAPGAVAAVSLNVGNNFASGTPLATTFVSATQVTAIVPAALIAQPGSVPITLANGGEVAETGGFPVFFGPFSNTVTLAIAPPAPVITSISPATVTAGSAALTLTVNGNG